MAERQPALVTPFWVRIAIETSLSPGWLLIAFPAVLYPTYLLLEALFGRGLTAATDFAGDFQRMIVPFYAAALGYLSMMGAYVARGTFRDLEAIRPMLQGGAESFADLRKQLTEFDRRRLTNGGLAGLVFFFVIAELAVERWTGLLTVEWSPALILQVATVCLSWIVLGRMAVYLIDTARFYSKIGEHRIAIDLLDLAPISPLTRHRLRVVLLLVILVAAAAVIWTVVAPMPTGSPFIVGGIFGGLLETAVVGLAVFAGMPSGPFARCSPHP
jgi:hypothetical protein